MSAKVQREGRDTVLHRSLSKVSTPLLCQCHRAGIQGTQHGRCTAFRSKKEQTNYSDAVYSSPSTNISKSLYVFDFSKANFTDISSILLDFDFSVCFQSYDIEFIWSTIKSVIFLVISLFVPKIKLKPINEPKWFNSEIRHHHNCLRKMKRKYKIHPNPNR